MIACSCTTLEKDNRLQDNQQDTVGHIGKIEMLFMVELPSSMANVHGNIAGSRLDPDYSVWEGDPNYG